MRVKMRKSEISAESFLRRTEDARRYVVVLEGEGVKTSVVFGGSEMAFSIKFRVACWTRANEMEERTFEVRREV